MSLRRQFYYHKSEIGSRRYRHILTWTRKDPAISLREIGERLGGVTRERARQLIVKINNSIKKSGDGSPLIVKVGAKGSKYPRPSQKQKGVQVDSTVKV